MIYTSMNTIDYFDAKNYITDKKITAFCVRAQDCHACEEWANRFFSDIEEKYKEDIDWYWITVDDRVMFPPQFSPTWYFYVPGQEQPFIRDGVLPQPEFNMSVDKLIRVKNGENPFHVFGR